MASSPTWSKLADVITQKERPSQPLPGPGSPTGGPKPGTREPAVGEVVALFAARHQTGTEPVQVSDRLRAATA